MNFIGSFSLFSAAFLLIGLNNCDPGSHLPEGMRVISPRAAFVVMMSIGGVLFGRWITRPSAVVHANQ